jgi:hypothetical protein
MAKDGITVATYQEMTAEEKELLLKKYGNKEGAKGILIRLSTYAATILEKLGLGGLLPAKASDVAATNAQTAANITFESTIWPILLVTLLLIAAIAILVVSIMAVVALIKAIQANTLEG